MARYLVDTGDFLVTVEDIKNAIGLETDAFDALIRCGIVSVCIGSPRRVRRETWAVEIGEEYGDAVKIGPLHVWNGKWFRNCTYEADASFLNVARRNVLAWVEDQDDIMLALADQSRCAPAKLSEVA